MPQSGRSVPLHVEADTATSVPAMRTMPEKICPREWAIRCSVSSLASPPV